MAVQSKGVTFAQTCQRWKEETTKEIWWKAHEELFSMCGVAEQGTKVLWLFIRDLLQLPAFSVDRWVRSNLEKHNLPPKTWYITEACLLAKVNANELNRAFFSSTNPNFS